MTAQAGLRYVYAVCRPFEAALQARLTGVAGAPPGLLRHRGLVAAVSTVPESDFAEEPLRSHLEDLDWLAVTARAHQGVIDALTTVTTPLPLRLATVFRDDDRVRVMMEAREADFLHTLDRLEGRVEWGVKLYADPPQPERASAPEGRPVSGRDYLRRRQAHTREHEEKWQAAEEFARALHERLSRRADDVRLHPPQNSTLSGDPGKNLLNAAYLVRRTDSEEFVALVDRTKDETTGMRVELTGPWAAYSFTEPLAPARQGESP
ncbi:GvpL/GvpF family gas vesicle protein [Streptomyces sp. NPDC004237]|uniref:GvpL/GvpF family gas vesicle protein n=1 Tax=Streptomyces sp. NPDC004237 TaxID=3154455 RepID=UPI0033A8B73F